MTSYKLVYVSVQKTRGFSSHLSYCMVFVAMRHYGTGKHSFKVCIGIWYCYYKRSIKLWAYTNDIRITGSYVHKNKLCYSDHRRRFHECFRSLMSVLAAFCLLVSSLPSRQKQLLVKGVMWLLILTWLNSWRGKHTEFEGDLWRDESMGLLSVAWV